MLLDTSPRAFVALAGTRLSRRAGRPWARFKPGAGTCKVDWALDGPVPWGAEACRRTVTVHVGGTFDEVARAEAAVQAGRHAEQPFVLVAQPCVVDPTRAPAGKHTLWAYCHVPNGSSVDMTERMEAQIERFAPGFRDLVLARSVRTAGRGGGAQSQSAGRRRQRWGGHVAPDGLPAGGAVESLPDAGRWCVSLLGLDAPGGRGPRDVWCGGGRGGVAGAVLVETSGGDGRHRDSAVSCSSMYQDSISSATQHWNSPWATT